jgi:hypothetical protein
VLVKVGVQALLECRPVHARGGAVAAGQRLESARTTAEAGRRRYGVRCSA